MAIEKNVPSFLNGFIRLFSGLAIVQVLNFGFSLILPRFYAPVDYALFGIFSSVIFILIEVITLKLEITIYFPKEDSEALEIVHSIFFVSSCFAAAVFFICLIGAFFWNAIYLLIPLTLMNYGIYLPLNSWFNRKKNYRIINTGRIIQALSIPLLSLFFILVPKWHNGLVLGFVLGQMAGIVYLLFSFKRFSFDLLRLNLMKRIVLKYLHFPKFGVISSLLGSFAKNGVVFFVKYFFGAIQAGYYTLSVRVLNAGAGLYQNSLSQVFAQQASHLENDSLKIYIKRVAWFGFGLGLIPAIILLVGGPQIFSFVFGNQWVTSGKMSQYLVAWIFSTAIISPVGILLDIRRKLLFELKWNASTLILNLAVLLAFGFLGNLYMLLLSVALIGVLVNLIMLIYVLRLADQKPSEPAANEQIS